MNKLNNINLLDKQSNLLEDEKLKSINKIRLKNAETELLDQWSDIYNLKMQKSNSWFRYSIWIIATILISFILWASFFELDEVTSGIGKVVPASREQKIQNIEAGVLTEILVKEGDLVEFGQTLIKIDDVKLGSHLQETRSKLQSLKAAAIRLRAESEGSSNITSNLFKDVNLDIVKNEINTFNAKRRTLDASLISLSA